MREPRQRVSLGYAKAAFALAKIFVENLTDARRGNSIESFYARSNVFQEENSRENAHSRFGASGGAPAQGIDQHRRSIKFRCPFTASVHLSQLYPQLRAAWNDNGRIVRGIRLSILK